MLLRILGAVGIGRCPYENKCGPETQVFDYDYEREDLERTCYTFEHRQCPNYHINRTQELKREERKNQENLDA